MIIFLCILGVLLLLLCIRVSVRVKWADELEVWVCYLFLRFKVVRPKEEAERLAKDAEKDAGKDLKKKEKKTGSEPKALEDLAAMVLDLVQSASGGLRMLLRDLRVSGLRLQVAVASADAGDTAIEYGRINAYLHGVYAALQHILRFRGTVFDIRPDFLSDTGRFAVEFAVSVTPLVALGAALRVGASFLARMVGRAAKKPPAPPKQEPTNAARQGTNPTATDLKG